MRQHAIRGYAAAALVLLTSFGAAHADAPPNYFAVMGSYVFTDSAREVDDGIGWHVLYGSPINARLGVELNAFGHRAKRDSIGERDYGYGLGGDLRYLFGTPRLGAFALGGLGMIWEDYWVGTPGSPRSEEEVSPFFNVGLGGQVGGERLQARAEARYYAIFNSELADDESVLYDARVNLGLQYAFGADAAPMETYEPVPLPVADSDQDGVPDDYDECPMTPLGMSVDARGCPIDPDSDGDGVRDSVDQCPDTPPGFKVDARGCVVEEQTVVVLRSVHFEFDSAKLTRDARTELDRVAQGLKGQPDLRIEVGGHTDAIGSEAYNLKLSTARAQSVRNFLIDFGIEPSRLTAQGYGEDKPIADNETDDGRAQNRRVEFRVLK